jgi:hypothetical protein
MSNASNISELEMAEHLNYADGKGVKRVSIYNNGAQVNVLTDELVHDNVHTGVKELRVYSEGHVCTQNSTSTPLGISGVFTGDWQDTLDYSEVIISVGTDKASITNGLQVLWSADAVNVNGDDVFTISANADKTFTFPCQRRYVKVIYTNDGVAQTRFNLSTLLKRFASKGSSHRLADTLDQQDDAIVTKSLIAGKTTAGGGAIVDVKVTPSGALSVESTPAAGGATEAKQDAQITLETTIASLAATIQELSQRIAFLGSIKQHQTESLRVTPVASVSTAVTGSLTSAGTVTTVGAITNFGTGYPATEVSHDINNSTAILANIQNVVVTS